MLLISANKRFHSFIHLWACITYFSVNKAFPGRNVFQVIGDFLESGKNNDTSLNEHADDDSSHQVSPNDGI